MKHIDNDRYPNVKYRFNQHSSPVQYIAAIIAAVLTFTLSGYARRFFWTGNPFPGNPGSDVRPADHLYADLGEFSCSL